MRTLRPSAQGAPRPGQMVIPYANEFPADLAMLAGPNFVSFSPLLEGRTSSFACRKHLSIFGVDESFR